MTKPNFTAKNVDVSIDVKHSEFVLTITNADGSTNTFLIESDAVHCGCSGLRIRQRAAEKYVPDWIDLEGMHE